MDNTDDEALTVIHREILKALEAFSEFCNAHALRFYVCGGTLLGAMRNGGVIPWDDDADVVMFREDYERLEQLMSRSPPDGYCWQGHGGAQIVSPNVFWGKFCPRKTRIVEIQCRGACPHHFGIDVFPLDHLPANSLKSYGQWFLSRYYQHLAPLLFGGTSNRHRFVKMLLRAMLRPFYRDENSLYRRFLSVSAWGAHDNRGMRVSLCGRCGCRHERFREEWFADRILVPFETMVVPVAAGWQLMLEMAFGRNWRLPRRNQMKIRHYRLNAVKHEE